MVKFKNIIKGKDKKSFKIEHVKIDLKKMRTKGIKDMKNSHILK